MNNQEYKRNRVKKFIGVIAASIFVFQEAATILYAQAAADNESKPVQTAVSTSTKAIREDAKNVSGINTEGYPYSRKARRKEKLAKWLENHPKIKERADKNGDGAVD